MMLKRLEIAAWWQKDIEPDYLIPCFSACLPRVFSAHFPGNNAEARTCSTPFKPKFYWYLQVKQKQQQIESSTCLPVGYASRAENLDRNQDMDVMGFRLMRRCPWHPAVLSMRWGRNCTWFEAAAHRRRDSFLGWEMPWKWNSVSFWRLNETRNKSITEETTLEITSGMLGGWDHILGMNIHHFNGNWNMF